MGVPDRSAAARTRLVGRVERQVARLDGDPDEDGIRTLIDQARKAEILRVANMVGGLAGVIVMIVVLAGVLDRAMNVESLVDRVVLAVFGCLTVGLYCFGAAVLVIQALRNDRVERAVRDAVDRRFGAHVRRGQRLAGGLQDPEAYPRHVVDVQASGEHLHVGLRQWRYAADTGWQPDGAFMTEPAVFDVDQADKVDELRALLGRDARQLDLLAREEHLSQLPAAQPLPEVDFEAEAQERLAAERRQQAQRLAAERAGLPVG